MSLFRQVVSKDFLLEVQQGLVPDHTVTWKFGHLVTSTTSAQETIWDGTGLYVYYLGFGVDAKKVDVASDNAADIYNLVIQGLDPDGNLIQETILLAGVNPVQSTLTYSRIFRAWNDNGTEFVGDIKVYETGIPANILAHVHAEEQQTQMAMFTVPLGFTAYLFYGSTSIGAGKQTSIRYVARAKDKVFRVQERFPLYETNLEAPRPYVPIPELTDIEVRSKASSLNDDVSAGMGILVIKNPA